MIAFVVESGVDMHAEDVFGWNALFYADACDMRILNMLLDAGLEESAKSKNGTTILHAFASRGHPVVIERLSKRLVPELINKKDDYGVTPLVRAVIAGREDVVAAYLEAGADPNLCADEGRTCPLNGAMYGTVLEHDVRIVELLLEAGADPNAVDHDGNSLLHSISPRMNGCNEHIEEIVELLLEAGADPDLNNDEGFTPLHLAVQSATADCAEILINAGSSPGIKDDEGRTVFDYIDEHAGQRNRRGGPANDDMRRLINGLK